MTARSPALPTASASRDAGAVASPLRRALVDGLSLSILFLVFMGAQVKSHGAGLAVPDWPLAYGRLWPEMVGGVFHEHWHRAIATGVGLLTIVVAVWTARSEARRWVRRLGWALLAAVIVQGLLGGLTVKQLLPPEVSATHAGLAQTVLCLAAWLAYACSGEWFRLDTERSAGDLGLQPAALRRGLRASALAMLAVYVQLGLGAWMRHNEAGLAVPFFPVDARGHLLPDLIDHGVVVHMAHRGFALVVLLLVWRAARLAGRAAPALVAHGAVLAGAVLAQGVLGGLVVWTGKAPALTSVHVANGALVLMLTWLLALRLWRRSATHAASSPDDTNSVTRRAATTAPSARAASAGPASAATTARGETA